jgi:hypothetical protein
MNATAHHIANALTVYTIAVNGSSFNSIDASLIQPAMHITAILAGISSICLAAYTIFKKK